MHLPTLLPSLLLCLPLAFASPVDTEKASTCQTGISPAESKKVVKKFKLTGITPYTVPSIAPSIQLNATFGSHAVNLGNYISPPDIKSAPSLDLSSESGQSSTATYSVFLIDITDSLNGKGYLLEEVAHVKCGAGNSGSFVTPFKTHPPEGSSPDQYALLAYIEPANYMPKTPSSRGNFDVVNYTSAAGLTLVGGNYYFSQL